MTVILNNHVNYETGFHDKTTKNLKSQYSTKIFRKDQKKSPSDD